MASTIFNFGTAETQLNGENSIKYSVDPLDGPSTVEDVKKVVLKRPGVADVDVFQKPLEVGEVEVVGTTLQGIFLGEVVDFATGDIVTPEVRGPIKNKKFEAYSSDSPTPVGSLYTNEEGELTVQVADASVAAVPFNYIEEVKEPLVSSGDSASTLVRANGHGSAITPYSDVSELTNNPVVYEGTSYNLLSNSIRIKDTYNGSAMYGDKSKATIIINVAYNRSKNGERYANTIEYDRSYSGDIFHSQIGVLETASSNLTMICGQLDKENNLIYLLLNIVESKVINNNYTNYFHELRLLTFSLASSSIIADIVIDERAPYESTYNPLFSYNVYYPKQKMYLRKDGSLSIFYLNDDKNELKSWLVSDSGATVSADNQHSELLQTDHVIKDYDFCELESGDTVLSYVYKFAIGSDVRTKFASKIIQNNISNTIPHFHIDSADTSPLNDLSIDNVAHSDGGFIVVFREPRDTSSKIRVLKFNSSGTEPSVDNIIHSSATNHLYYPIVSELGDSGRFIVFYRDSSSSSSSNIEDAPSRFSTYSQEGELITEKSIRDGGEHQVLNASSSLDELTVLTSSPHPTGNSNIKQLETKTYSFSDNSYSRTKRVFRTSADQAVDVLRYIVAVEAIDAGPKLIAADVTGNGTIQADDAVKILRDIVAVEPITKMYLMNNADNQKILDLKLLQEVPESSEIVVIMPGNTTRDKAEWEYV